MFEIFYHVFPKGNFDIRYWTRGRESSKVVSASRNHIHPVHRQDGYCYSFVKL